MQGSYRGHCRGHAGVVQGLCRGHCRGHAADDVCSCHALLQLEANTGVCRVKMWCFSVACDVHGNEWVKVRPDVFLLVMCAGVYAVLGRRRARVVREEMREGSDLFSIHAYLPAQASFGFANDMRRQSSGSKLLLIAQQLQQERPGPVFIVQ